jgi:MFS family permease
MNVRSVGEQRREKRIAISLFLLLLLCYIYTLPRWADQNQNSRLDMVVAVVDDGTFRIDDYVENTVDYAKVGEHYYSDKAPGAAFLGIPVYALLKSFFDLPIMDSLMSRLANNEALKATLREEGTGLLEHKVRFAIAQTVLTFVASALPTALLGVLMYRLLARFTTRSWPRMGVVLGYGLLTPAFAYAGAFYGHQLSAACLFTAFYLVFVGTKPLPTRSLLAVGFLLSYSVITEYPSVLIAGILFLYIFYRLSDQRRIGWVFLAGALIAAGWMIYNTAVFGSPLELGYSHSELWNEQHHTGFMSLTWPRWEVIWGITFSPFRGLFVLSPLLLLAVPGFILWWRSGEHRIEFWVALVSVLAMFLFNSSSIMWWGGFTIGPRYLLPMLPFMALPMIFVFREWKKRVWIRVLSIALFAWSLIATWGLTLAEQAFPSETFRNPLLEYAWPNWQVGNIARNLGMFLHLPGIVSLLPLLVSVTVLLAALRFLSREEQVPVTESRSV